MSEKSNGINNSKDHPESQPQSALFDSFPTAQIAPEDYVHIYHFDPKSKLLTKSPPKSASKSKTEAKKKKSSAGSGSSNESKSSKPSSNESISQSRHKTSNLGFVNAGTTSSQKTNKSSNRVKSAKGNRKSNKGSSARIATKPSKTRPTVNSKSKFATITGGHKTQKGISNDSLMTNKGSSENEVPEWIIEIVARFLNGLPEHYTHGCDKHCKCKSKKHRSCSSTSSNTSRQSHRKHKSKQKQPKTK